MQRSDHTHWSTLHPTQANLAIFLPISTTSLPSLSIAHRAYTARLLWSCRRFEIGLGHVKAGYEGLMPISSEPVLKRERIDGQAGLQP